MLGNILLKYRIPLCFLLVGTSIYSVIGLFRIEIKQDFSTYFPRGDADRQFYEKIIGELGDEDDLLSIALVNESGIFDTVFLRKVADFTNAANVLPDVERAFSITNVEDAVRTPFGIVPQPFLTWDSAGQFNTDSAGLAADPRIAERLFSKKMNALLVTLQLEHDLDPRREEAVIAALESKLDSMKFDRTYIGGLVYYEVNYNRTSNRELIWGTVKCIGILVLLLGFVYQSGWGVVLPLLVFCVSLLNLLGYLVLRGHPLDIMSNLYPTIMLVVSVSDVIHIFSKYEDRIKQGQPRLEAIRLALNDAGLGTFLTSFTTAIGFLALAISSIPATTKFGLDMALGVMLAYFVTVVMLVSLMPFIRPSAFVASDFLFKKWERSYSGIAKLIQQKGRLLTRASVLLAAVSVASLFFINTNHHLESAVSTEALHKSVAYFDEEAAGARTFEMAILPKNSHRLNDLALLEQIEKLHNHLDSLPQLGGVYSPATFYKSLNKSMHGGGAEAYALPETQEDLNRSEKAFRKFKPAFVSHIMNKERTVGKVSARIPDLGRLNVKKIDQSVEEWVAEHLDSSLVQVKITGASHMVDRVQEISIRSMFSGLAFSFVVIGLLMALLFRNWKVTLISIWVNAWPLLLTAACMALFGIELRYGTSIMFTIGFVIAVDDTVHLLLNYKFERRNQPDEHTAILSALNHTGRAMTLTSLLLVGGFGILMTSSFRDSQDIGLLTSLLLVFAILADLLLCPRLLMDVFEEQKTRKPD